MTHKELHHDLKIDRSFITSVKGIKALKVSFLGLMLTALLQLIIVYYSGSTALLADTFHNFLDAFTVVPLWFAYLWARRKPNERFTYGYNRFEDIAGIFIVLLIFGTAIVIGIDSLTKIKQGYVVKHLEWVVAASIIGFLGNEWVARYRIKIGREINSAALVADGQHARADGFTSLGVLVGAIGVYFGFPMADPLVGLVIAILIVHIGWGTGRELFQRLADAIPPEKVGAINKVAQKIEGVLGVYDTRARFVGRNLRVELTIAVDKNMTVYSGHEIAIKVQHALQKEFPDMISPSIHVDPEGHRGEDHHFVEHHKA